MVDNTSSKKYNIRLIRLKGSLSVIVFIVGNSNHQSSNPGWVCLHFILHEFLWESHESISSHLSAMGK